MRATEQEPIGTPVVRDIPETGDSGKSTKPKKDARSSGWYKVARYATMPLLLAIVCGSLYLYVSSLDLDSIELRSLNYDVISTRTIEHLQLTIVATIAVVIIAVGAGVILTRPALKKVAPYVIAVASTGQAMPSIGVIVLIVVLFQQFGFGAAIVALVITSFLPILRNTMVGINQVDKSVIESGRGMGMTKSAVLIKIELPLAVPIMLAGVRTALILVVGTAALATFINAGGLGAIINTGIKTARDPILITGAILTAALALAVDYVAGLAEDFLKPKGL